MGWMFDPQGHGGLQLIALFVLGGVVVAVACGLSILLHALIHAVYS